MTELVRRMREIDKQLAVLTKIISSGSHVGAGLTCHITVGRAPDNENEDTHRPTQVEVALCHKTEEILQLVVESLKKFREMNLILLKSELAAMQTFLSDEEEKATVKPRDKK